MAELQQFIGQNLTSKNVFGGHLGSRDLDLRSKVTNILPFYEGLMPQHHFCKVWLQFFEYF